MRFQQASTERPAEPENMLNDTTLTVAGNVSRNRAFVEENHSHIQNHDENIEPSFVREPN